MDFEKIIVDVNLKTEPLNEAREKHLAENPDIAEQEKEDEVLFLENCKKQLAEYIKSFRKIPTKKVWFSNDFFDDYHVTYWSIEPLSNRVYCYLEF